MPTVTEEAVSLAAHNPDELARLLSAYQADAQATRDMVLHLRTCVEDALYVLTGATKPKNSDAYLLPENARGRLIVIRDRLRVA